MQLEDELGNFIELFEHDAPIQQKEDPMDFQHIGIKHISFLVDDLEKSYDFALKQGASAVRSPQAGSTVKKNAFIADPDGIVIELVEL